MKQLKEKEDKEFQQYLYNKARHKGTFGRQTRWNCFVAEMTMSRNA